MKMNRASHSVSRRAVLPFLCLLALALGLCLSPASGDSGRGDWFMFHHDPQHTGRSAFTGPASPVQKWAFPVDCDLYNAFPVIGADGTIYFGNEVDNNSLVSGALYAINPDGTEKWAFSTSLNDDMISNPAIGADGTIYIGSDCLDQGNLYAIGGPSSVLPLSALTLSAVPASSQPTNTPITLTAVATGGTNLSYQFWLYNPAATPAWSQLQRYSSSAACTWTPTATGTYLLSATAQDGVSGAEVNTTVWYSVE